MPSEVDRRDCKLLFDGVGDSCSCVFDDLGHGLVHDRGVDQKHALLPRLSLANGLVIARLYLLLGALRLLLLADHDDGSPAVGLAVLVLRQAGVGADVAGPRADEDEVAVGGRVLSEDAPGGGVRHVHQPPVPRPAVSDLASGGGGGRLGGADEGEGLARREELDHGGVRHEDGRQTGLVLGFEEDVARVLSHVGVDHFAVPAAAALDFGGEIADRVDDLAEALRRRREQPRLATPIFILLLVVVIIVIIVILVIVVVIFAYVIFGIINFLG